MKTITATVQAFITNQWTTIDTLSKSTPECAVSLLALYQPPEGGNAPDGWVRVGLAEVTVTFDADEQIVGNQIGMLRAAKKKVQADAELALTQLEGQIQNLLCIEGK